MITFTRNNSEVKAEINLDIPIEKPVLCFSWPCSHEYQAYILRETLADKLFTLVQRIRREEYEAGWKDAKGRKIKRQWFSGILKVKQ